MQFRPCPFCDNAHDFSFQTGNEDREGTPINVICEECGACGPWKYGEEKDAIELWNQRSYLKETMR